MKKMRKDAKTIIEKSLHDVMPETAVKKALSDKEFLSDNIYIVAVGKAAWNMANAASEVLGSKIKKGLIITKYKHSKGPINGLEIIEAGHPIPDGNSMLGAYEAINLVSSLSEKDELLFLISGGGSALFELPLEGIMLEDIMDITGQLLNCGADIVEINTVRKHLSEVKGGRFAEKCKAKIFSIVLSDVIGDRLDSIASGPAFPDESTSEEALAIIEKYNLSVEENMLESIKKETPKKLLNVTSVISGSVKSLCLSAAKNAQKLGYEPYILSSALECEAREAGRILANIAQEIMDPKSIATIKKPCAIILGGETVVRLIGNGDGGRNQELALSGALGIEGLENVVLISLGSDGTDGPTDAAGGIVDGKSAERIRISGRMPEVELDNNNSYHALKASGDLIFTGATGTNVNDLMMLLCK